MKFCFVEDDAEKQRQLEELCKINFPDVSISFYESLYEASSATTDILIVDISAVWPMMIDVHKSYGPICSYLDRHPGVQVIIFSGMSKDFCDDVIDEVKRMNPESQIFYGGWGDWEILKNKLKELIS